MGRCVAQRKFLPHDTKPTARPSFNVSMSLVYLYQPFGISAAARWTSGFTAHDTSRTASKLLVPIVGATCSYVTNTRFHTSDMWKYLNLMATK